jgi:hypothetical protein
MNVQLNPAVVRIHLLLAVVNVFQHFIIVVVIVLVAERLTTRFAV